jgi:hypothetical protein
LHLTWRCPRGNSIPPDAADPPVSATTRSLPSPDSCRTPRALALRRLIKTICQRRTPVWPLRRWTTAERSAILSCRASSSTRPHGSVPVTPVAQASRGPRDPARASRYISQRGTEIPPSIEPRWGYRAGCVRAVRRRVRGERPGSQLKLTRAKQIARGRVPRSLPHTIRRSSLQMQCALHQPAQLRVRPRWAGSAGPGAARYHRRYSPARCRVVWRRRALHAWRTQHLPAFPRGRSNLDLDRVLEALFGEIFGRSLWPRGKCR